MENDFCQNHLYHNYNMLITYFIKEVDYGSMLEKLRLTQILYRTEWTFLEGSYFLHTGKVQPETGQTPWVNLEQRFSQQALQITASQSIPKTPSHAALRDSLYRIVLA